MIKKVTYVIFVIIVSSFFLTSCKIDENSVNAIAREQAEVILECLKTGEKEELKALFCEEVKNTHDLDKEIQEAIEFIDGEIIDDGTMIGMSKGGESISDGVTVKLDIHPSIIDLRTDAQNTYLIFFDTYLIYDEKKKI